MLAVELATDHVPCTDAFDRARSVGVWAAPIGGKVVLVAPPAETALLTPAQARELRDRLDLLANEVEAAQHRLSNRQTLYGVAAV
jgi:hypothetical protein